MVCIVSYLGATFLSSSAVVTNYNNVKADRNQHILCGCGLTIWDAGDESPAA
jgi:hypothetical protein